jgi:hypothetical protein
MPPPRPPRIPLPYPVPEDGGCGLGDCAKADPATPKATAITATSIILTINFFICDFPFIYMFVFDLVDLLYDTPRK